ncbi:phosphoglycerate dehydrogenase-like enzyme [Rhizobium sp. BK313]|uniref:D-2-hydroxyacid dehydrogenase family protein n=1 Tax=Rhizobium sp. BK313 TaxID=2587081 RepID=UPI00105F6122|nr:D-2-hydroxyacid dehydrogenase family protein [Rhizobium sp. BK313]MBB3459420.1 phosphoglycerate dehydrogenase-like enzyme [Rhizobium sp. BK313]
MTKVAVLDDWQGVAAASADWSALTAKADVTFFENSLSSEDEIADRLKDFDILMSMRERTRFPASLAAKLPKLRMLNVTGGRNRSVDLAALQARGVVVSCTESGNGGEATAELALGLMLSAARHLPAADAAIRAGRFQNGVPMGTVLSGRTLGLIGLGNLGSRMAGYGKALGMKVLAWSPNLTVERAKEAGVEFVPKAELLAQADFVSVHVVLAPTTIGILGKEDLARMKPGAVLINTSRAPLVDQDALMDAVTRGAIFAALDVYELEPLPLDHPLRNAPNTVLTPHLGYCVAENFRVFHTQGIENVLAFLAGAPIRPMKPQM